ncbi:MAG: SDR family oxidoreductase [SAR324 cluster bacterium]|nr:SDR family oxidoreductase [SAR324 cluster bacterium]
MGRLADKTAVITGGGSGIGRSMALRFAQEGAKVAILEMNDESAASVLDQILSEGGEAQSYHCDVSSQDSVRDCFKKVIDQFKHLDILINNAGIAHIGNVESTESADLDRIYQVNIKGVFHCIKTAVPTMVDQGKGVILNLASIASKLGISDRFAYSMSKGAVLTMTLSVAKDYVDKGIRCNCICPARVHTPFVDGYLKQHYPGKEEEMFQKLSEYQPIGRMGLPDEMASLALFLCSDEASFITGSAYDIDGGVMTLK